MELLKRRRGRPQKYPEKEKDILILILEELKDINKKLGEPITITANEPIRVKDHYSP